MTPGTNYDANFKKMADLLRRLLGPEGPEVGCDQCFEQLDQYVELELAGADADERLPGMRAHLQGCPACSEDHASLRALLEKQKDR
jgi:hypothetical protein